MVSIIPEGCFHPAIVHGTKMYFYLGLVASVLGVIASPSLTKGSKNITKSEGIQFSLIMVWTAVVCMWLFWVFVYMHQMVPLIQPIHTAVA
jgi:V-type H+-transporting ATPase subunit e